MTSSEFEKVYEANYTKALNAARKISREYAEDAVAESVVYLLANLNRFQQITPSYFIQKCVNRTRDLIRNQHSDLVIPVGGTFELAATEEMEAEKADGRAFHAGKRND